MYILYKNIYAHVFYHSYYCYSPVAFSSACAHTHTHTHTHVQEITKLQFRKCQQRLSNLTPQRMRLVPEFRLPATSRQPQFYKAVFP